MEEQPQLAIADFKDAIIHSPSDFYSFMNLGFTYLQLGEQKLALQFFDRSLQIDPRVVFSIIGRGNVFKRAGDNERASAEYNRAVQIGTSVSGVYIARGNFYRDVGDLDRALADYNQAFRVDQKAFEAFSGRADVARLRGNAEEALILYNEALRFDASIKGAIRGRDIILAKQNNPKAPIFNSYAEANTRLRELLREGDNQKTLEVLNTILAMPELNDDQKYETLQTRSYTLAYLGRVDEGIADRQECVNIADRTVHSNAKNLHWARRRDLANLLRDAGRFDDALKVLDDAAAILGPGTFDQSRTLVLELKGDYAGAAAIYEKYLANPQAVTALHALTRTSALSSLSWIKLRQGDEKQAISLMEQSFKLRSNEPSAQISMVYMLANVGRVDDAIALLASSEPKIKEKNIRDILVVSRGIMEFARGKNAEAIEILAEGMPSFGNDLFPNLYLHFARLRAGQSGSPDMENIAAKLNPNSWNGKLAQYILGKIDRQQLEAATKHPLSANERSQRCTMNFVTGQRALLEKDLEVARRDLTAVLGLCNPGAQNYVLAKYDLERLKK